MGSAKNARASSWIVWFLASSNFYLQEGCNLKTNRLQHRMLRAVEDHAAIFRKETYSDNCLDFSTCTCHPCAGAMLINLLCNNDNNDNNDNSKITVIIKIQTNRALKRRRRCKRKMSAGNIKAGQSHQRTKIRKGGPPIPAYGPL